MTDQRKIPWARPSLVGNELRYLNDAFESTWISGGAYVERLEREFADFVGSSNAVAVSSGTAALHLAYLAAGLGPGDEVVVPALTFAGAAAMVIAVGAEPRFADCDLETLGLSAASTAATISPRTKAVVPTHLFGNSTDLDPIIAVARANRIMVIEDAAEAVGTRYRGAHVGTLGVLGCFSFQAAKTLTMGEGGMIVTPDADKAAQIRLLRNHGFRPGTHYWHDVVGFNYRLTNLQAAIGCAQLERVDEILRDRERIALRYAERLGQNQALRLPQAPASASVVLWMQAVVLEATAYPQGRDAVRAALADEGIETRPMFNVVYAMPPYRRFAADCRNAEHLSQWGMSLPVFEGLADQDIDRICTSLERLRR